MQLKINLYEFIIYLIAFAVGLAPVVFTALIALASMMPSGGLGRNSDTEYYLMLFQFSPIAGLACFQMIFSLSTGNWRNWKFWLIVPVIVYGSAATAWWLVTSTIFTFFRFSTFAFMPVLALLLGFVFLTGLIFLQWSKVHWLQES